MDVRVSGGRLELTVEKRCVCVCLGGRGSQDF